MPTLADLIASRTRAPSATVYLGGQRCRAVLSLRTSQAFGSGIATGTIVLRDPPVTPAIGTAVSWRWGFNGVEVPGFTGEIARPARKSYPNRYTIECRDVLWRADRSQQVIATDPLNNITASDAIRYILTHYGGIPASRIALPVFSASGSAWGGSEWTLGMLTPVSWGDTENNTGGTTALKACQEICSVLGYWLYADASGIIRAKQMERAPSLSPVHTFQRGVDLLTEGSPELTEDIDALRTRIIVRGANTGVDGAQIMDTFQTSHPLLPSGVYQEDTFSSTLIEYVNASDAGAASATEIAKRILRVRSRPPVIVRHRTKADPRLAVGATVAIQDVGIGYSTAKNFFIYALDTSLDCVTGAFDQQHTLDGGTGNSGYSTIPPPDASFSWRLMAETLDGDAVVEVFLDGSGSTSPSEGEIVSWAWSTSTPTYGGSPDTATGEHAVLLFLASASTANITLTVTDTTSKQGTITQTIDLTGADTARPIARVLSVAFGAAWAVTPDGGATWNVETSNGDAIAVGTIGAGADDRSPTSAGDYGLLATRGSGGTGLRQTLDMLATASANAVSAGGAITSNIWVNEANPARVWFAKGSTVYRSTDGGATATAMTSAPATVHWIMEDASTENSVFLLAGANMYNATAPEVGWALLYSGPLGSTARQFVRSRDGQVTWVCYTGAPAGEALQRVENGAAADFGATDVRSLALDNAASSLLATLYAVTGDDPAQIWTFDGLTGLSAAQATPTLPAGATAQHMLADPDVDLFYIADFDSVASGTGAVRKFLADQLFLYKAGATGQQAHMLGFGGRVVGPYELLLMTYTVDPAGVWHYKDGGWTFRPLPVSGTARGLQIVADPFNADRWLAVFNNADASVSDSGGNLVGASWAYSPLWLTSDAGVTWEEIVIPTPPGLPGSAVLGSVAWSEQGGGVWAVVMGATNYLCVVRGTNGTITSTTEATGVQSFVLASGLDGDFVLVARVGTAGELRYIDNAGVLHTPSGASPDDMGADIYLPRILDRTPGNSRAVAVAGRYGNLYTTADYRAAQPTLDQTSADTKTVARSTAALYYTDAGEISGAGTLWRGDGTQIGPLHHVRTTVRVDRQTRTLAGCYVDGAILIDDGTSTTIMPLTLDSSALSDGNAGATGAFEIMVRS